MKWTMKDPDVFPAGWHVILMAGPDEAAYLLKRCMSEKDAADTRRRWNIFMFSCREWGGKYGELEARYSRRLRTEYNGRTWDVLVKVSELIRLNL